MAKKQWLDETGLEIPASRVTKAEKLKEVTCEKLLKKSQRVNQILVDLKEEMTSEAERVLNAVIEENGGTPRENYKGNFTFFNFDRSIKVEAAVQEKITFDDAMIIIAKDHFDTFLEDATSIGGVDAMIRDMILDAFSTAKGKLDTDKVLGLTKYRSRIDKAKYPSFHAALDAIEKGINRQVSKKYHRISFRNDAGEYENIQLNFSAL
jgi:hypothetical protein